MLMKSQGSNGGQSMRGIAKRRAHDPIAAALMGSNEEPAIGQGDEAMNGTTANDDAGADDRQPPSWLVQRIEELSPTQAAGSAEQPAAQRTEPEA